MTVEIKQQLHHFGFQDNLLLLSSLGHRGLCFVDVRIRKFDSRSHSDELFGLEYLPDRNVVYAAEQPIPSEEVLDDVGLELSEEDIIELSFNQHVLSEFDQGDASLVDRCCRLLR